MPEYPPASQNLGEQGPVVLRLLVGPNGVVMKGEVVSSSGFDRLDQAALDALSQCRFNPAMVDGKLDLQPNWTVMRYVWKLDAATGNAGNAPRERSWYTLAANKEQMVVVDQNSASAKDGVISFVQSRILYTMTKVEQIETPVRRVDTLQSIDCKQNKWRATGLVVYGDDGKPLAKAKSESPDKEEWLPIAAGTLEVASSNLFCAGHFDKRLVRQEQDLYLIQQAYVKAAEQLQ